MGWKGSWNGRRGKVMERSEELRIGRGEVYSKEKDERIKYGKGWGKGGIKE